MHITDSLVNYDSGFPGYNVPSSGYPTPWTLVYGLRLDGGGFAIIDVQQTAHIPNNTYQIRMYRIDAGHPLSVSGATTLSLGTNYIAGACAVPGTSSVQLTTSAPAMYTYDFSGSAPSQTVISTLPNPGGFPVPFRPGLPVVALTSSLSVVVMNTSQAFSGLLGLAWQWAEGYVQVVSGTPQPITNVAAWHTSIVSLSAVGGDYSIADAARLSGSSFVVLAAQGNAGGSGAGSYAPTILMQMDLSGNIVSQTTVPNPIVSTSQGYVKYNGPRFLRGTDGSLYLSYIWEAGTAAGAGGRIEPYVVALDPSTGQPTGAFHQYTLIPAEPNPNDSLLPSNASGIAGGQWFIQSQQRIFLAQQATVEVASSGAGTYIDPSFWGASLNHDFPVPPDFNPPGSVVGTWPGRNGIGDQWNSPINNYTAIFATSATTAICIAADYPPLTAGKAHTVFRVTSDPLYRPAPPPIVTTRRYPPGFLTQLIPMFVTPPPHWPPSGFTNVLHGIYYVYTLTVGIDAAEWAALHQVGPNPSPGNYSSQVFPDSFYYPYGPPPTSPGTAFLLGWTGVYGFDQNSPYVITVGSVDSLNHPVYTQRFDIAGEQDAIYIYNEHTYTWRDALLTWTDMPVAPPPPTVRGKIIIGPQTLRPRVLDRSATVDPQSVTLGLSTSGVPSTGGNLQFGPQSVRPR